MLYFLISIVGFFSYAIDDQTSDKVMEVLCLPTIITSTGDDEYKEQVYVVTQVNTDKYSGELLVAPNPRQNGLSLLFTEQIPFDVQIYKSVSGVINIQLTQEEILNLINDKEPSEVVQASGYRSAVPNDSFYYFEWSNNQSVPDYIRIDGELDTATTYNDGDNGGRIKCLPPYLVSQ